jgi:hypothetical protein
MPEIPELQICLSKVAGAVRIRSCFQTTALVITLLLAGSKSSFTRWGFTPKWLANTAAGCGSTRACRRIIQRRAHLCALNPPIHLFHRQVARYRAYPPQEALREGKLCGRCLHPGRTLCRALAISAQYTTGLAHILYREDPMPCACCAASPHAAVTGVN